MADFAPTHPGEILMTEFLEPMGISQYRIAKVIDVSPRRINEIVHGKRGISADTALRLGRYFGMSAPILVLRVAWTSISDRMPKPCVLSRPVTDTLSIARSGHDAGFAQHRWESTFFRKF